MTDQRASVQEEVGEAAAADPPSNEQGHPPGQPARADGDAPPALVPPALADTGNTGPGGIVLISASATFAMP